MQAALQPARDIRQAFIVCPPSKLQAERFLASLKEKGLKIKKPPFDQHDFSETDVVRALNSAFAKGREEQELLEKLADLLKSTDPVDAMKLIARINQVTGGPLFMREKDRNEYKRRNLGKRPYTKKSFFTINEGVFLAECGVPGQRIRSGELTEQDKNKVIEAIERLDPQAFSQIELNLFYSRFGLNGSDPMSFRAMSEETGKTIYSLRDRILKTVDKIRRFPPALR